MRIAVTGGRNLFPWAAALAALEAQGGPHELIHGAAEGTDTVCALTAKKLGWKVTAVEADWLLGRKAGPLRNQKMIDMKPDTLLRFSGGRGTQDCERRARAAGIPVVMVE